MTPSDAKRRARAIRATAVTAGQVVVVQDGLGRLHAMPGRADVVGTYSATVDLAELAADLQWLASQADSRGGED